MHLESKAEHRGRGKGQTSNLVWGNGRRNVGGRAAAVEIQGIRVYW